MSEPGRIMTDLKLIKLTGPNGEEVAIEFSGDVFFEGLEPVVETDSYYDGVFTHFVGRIMETKLTFIVRPNEQSGTAYTVFNLGDGDGSS